ncbi:hypothetical protein PspLS_07176 [Pyricularia sp. CBS 133598]|nr:hypothetical protein PspLS_07176 [Pyricularia sp. CBS 133598]
MPMGEVGCICRELLMLLKAPDGDCASVWGRHIKLLNRSRLLVHWLGVDVGDVAAARMPIGETRYVGGERAVRETSVAVGGLRGMARKAANRAGGSLNVLHLGRIEKRKN